MIPHPYDVTIIFLDYDVIIFDCVNPYGIVTSLCPCVPEAELSSSTYLDIFGNEAPSSNELVKIFVTESSRPKPVSPRPCRLRGTRTELTAAVISNFDSESN